MQLKNMAERHKNGKRYDHPECVWAAVKGRVSRVRSRDGRVKEDRALTRDRVTEDREIRIALEGHRAGRSLREMAEDEYGPARAAANWGADSWTRARTRWLLRKARASAERDGRNGGIGPEGDD